MAKTLQIILPERALGLVTEAAERAGCKSSTWARQVVYAALRAAGFDPTGVPVNGWGPERQVALVDGDTIVTLLKYTTPSEINDAAREIMGNGRKLYPVEYRDAVPFDPEKHYRLMPEMFIEGEKVIRQYPIIDKSEDVG